MAKVSTKTKYKQEIGLGELLVKEKVLPEDKIQYAKKVQAKLEQDQPLGEVLVGLSLITRSELKKILQIHKASIPLGELMVEQGVLKREDLEAALEVQKKNPGKRIGQVLVEMGFITERELLKALSEKEGIPFIEPNLAMLDDELMGRFSLKFLVNNSLLPLTEEDGVLRFLTSSIPPDSKVKELEGAAGGPVAFALGAKESIDRTLREYTDLKVEGTYSGRGVDAEGRIIELADFIIAEAMRMGASDIHLEPLSDRLRLRYRIDGVLIHRTDLPKEMEPRLITRLKILSDLDIAEHRRHQDGRFKCTVDGQELDMRVSTYVTINGQNLVMRILNKQSGLLLLDELGMPPRIMESYQNFVLRVPAGVVVITGPTGSGKTTTLYSSIDAVNEMGVKIITAEDPVEYQIEGIMQCSINPKIGLTFEDTLKAIVRQDPDIIVLGEMRDRISAETAIQAALTGHKVFTTFHTEDSVGGILRLLNMKIEAFLISSTVICVVAQRLVRRICENCKVPAKPNPKDLAMLQLDPGALASFQLYRGKGCKYCHYTGFRGRTAIYELLVLDEAVKEAILQRMSSFKIRKLSIEKSGLITLQEAGIAKAVQGLTTLDEVIQKAPPSLKPRPPGEILRLIGESA